MTSSILSVRSLSKTYREKQVLSEISLEIKERDFVCMLGPSGCGKSTLLRCISGFEEYQGSIWMDGQIMQKNAPECAVVFQDTNQLFPWKTVLSNVMYPLLLKGERRKEAYRKAEYYLEKVNMLEHKSYYPYQLSGGMKQRTAIARTLVAHPKLILMDEPFASLDAMTRNQLGGELCDIVRNENATVLFITHNIQEAIVLGSRIIMLSSKGTKQMDLVNPLKKPVTPASRGYGELWETLNDGLHEAAVSAWKEDQ